jgi:hypothetical protein
MKVNLTIEVSDPVRNALASALDRRASRRLATREEVRSFIVGSVNSLAGPVGHTILPLQAVDGRPCPPPPSSGPASDLYRIDAEDAEYLRNKSPSFIYGWNKVKRRGGSVA